MKKILSFLFLTILSLNAIAEDEAEPFEDEVINFNLNPGLYIFQDIKNKTREYCVREKDILSTKRRLLNDSLKSNSVDFNFCRIMSFDSSDNLVKLKLSCYMEPNNILIETNWIFNGNEFFINNKKVLFTNDKDKKEYQYNRKFSKISECEQ